MRKIFFLIPLAMLALGCGSQEAASSKKEEGDFRNPSKEMPKEAIDAMQKGSAPPAGARTGATTG